MSSNSAHEGVLDTTLCDKACQWIATCQWFIAGTPVSSTTKTLSRYNRNIVESGVKQNNHNSIDILKKLKSLEYMSTNTKRKKGLKMLKGQLESVYQRRTDNGQKKKGQKGKQRSTKHYTERIEQHEPH